MRAMDRRTVRRSVPAIFIVAALAGGAVGLPWGAGAAPLARSGPPEVLMVADEIPAMETLARELETRARIKSTIVTQDKLPPRLAAFGAVIVYIHRDLAEAAENAFIDYAEGGGTLVLLHHSISSGKRKNKRWFGFLGITLPTGELDAGGYKYYDDVSFSVVNAAPGHVVTKAKISYPAKVAYKGSAPRPAFQMERTEVYVNHVLAGERTILLGLRYVDAKTSRTFEQDTAGWVRPAGQGRVYYFMPGHYARDFQHPVYAQILTNAVTARR
jgi:hypothetical protein